MSAVMLLTNTGRRPEEVLPALSEVACTVWMQATGEIDRAVRAPADFVMVDARDDLVCARKTCREVASANPRRPLLAVFTVDGLAALHPGWMVDDVILRTAGAGEVSMRLRLAADRHRQQARRRPEADRFALDEADRSVRVCGRRLSLTYTEFEILCCLARRPGQVVAHTTILDHLYNGEPRGTSRTVQTHLRRIRVKLGPEHAGLIQTVHGIGYRLRADLRGSTR